MLTAFAPAKVNLYLHILNCRDDGYHALESLVVFADASDELTLDPLQPFSLQIEGPFAKDCDEAENSILKAVHALQLRAPGLKLGTFTLQKNLPVAAGLGGGSADAAAALRLLAQLNDIARNDPVLNDFALHAGADVPVCLSSQSALIRGIGEQVTPVELPSCAGVLVNCGKPVLTRDVFAKFKLKQEQHEKDFQPPLDFTALISFLKTKANDLAAAARELCPAIKIVEQAIEETGAALTRLSGSGATVFGLYDLKGKAEAAAQLIRQSHPQWWVKAVTLGSINS